MTPSMHYRGVVKERRYTGVKNPAALTAAAGYFTVL